MFPKTGKELPIRKGSAPLARKFALEIAGALRDELGDTHRAVKTVMSWTGVSERTARNWLSSVRGPTGDHLVLLIHHSDATLRTVLRMAGRQHLITGLEVVNAPSRLIEIKDKIEALLDELNPRQGNKAPRA